MADPIVIKSLTVEKEGNSYVINDTTYESKAAASGGTDVSLVTTGEKYTWNSKTSNTGTVTKVSTGAGLTGGDITTTGTVKANLTSETKLTNAAADGTETSGRVYPVRLDKNSKLAVNVPWTDSTPVTSVAGKTGAVTLVKGDVGLGNVDNKSSATIRGELTSGNVTTALGFTPMDSALKGAANGVAELGSDGKVPSSQLPSYVDDVLEYASSSNFPTTGEAGKIYIAQDTNKTYRWSGTAYTEISASLALGTTSSTAFRGDYGNSAYTHAVTNKGSAFTSGLYKITTNSEGHVTAATAVAKADITGLGIPGSDTNTHRPIQVNGTQVLGDNTTALNLKAGSNMSVTNSSGTVTFAATDTTYEFDGTYDSSTNKAATVSTVTNAIAALDGNLNDTTPGTGKTLSAFSQTDGVVSATFSNISITKSQVSDFPTSMTPASHTHGNITNAGALQTTDVAIASGDKLVVTDSSNSSKIARTSLAFDGSTATKALTQKGTWESFTNNAGTITSVKMNGSTVSSSGAADLGTVITAHQTIKQDGVTGATINRFGTCSTAAATAAKTVTITTGDFSLEAGAVIAVSFTNKNTANTPTLAVNSTTAKNIFVNGAKIGSGTNKGLLNGTVFFVYDGTQYHIIGNYIDSDNDTHRVIKVNGTQALASNTTALNLIAGTNVTITDGGSGAITFAATDTTYSSEAAASGGTAVSLCTTGEKYTWNNKQAAVSVSYNSTTQGLTVTL